MEESRCSNDNISENSSSSYKNFCGEYENRESNEYENNNNCINIFHKGDGNINTINNVKITYFIIGKFEIKINSINEKIQIINSYENWKRFYNNLSSINDWEYNNEKEIKNNIEIIINDKKIFFFSYYYLFDKPGEHIIKYSFKKNISNISYMFSCCNFLTDLNFSNFESKNITNMSNLFKGCISLTNIDFSQLDISMVAFY